MAIRIISSILFLALWSSSSTAISQEIDDEKSDQILQESRALQEKGSLYVYCLLARIGDRYERERIERQLLSATADVFERSTVLLVSLNIPEFSDVLSIVGGVKVFTGIQIGREMATLETDYNERRSLESNREIWDEKGCTAILAEL